MGIDNRFRRRAKKQKRQRGQRLRETSHHDPADSASRWASGTGDLPDEEAVRAAVLAAAEAFGTEPEAAYQSRLEALGVLEARVGGPSIQRGLAWWVERGLDRAWASGWQPADVLRALRRTLSPAHAHALGPAVTQSGARRPEAAFDDRWADQLAAIGDDLGGPPARPPDSDLAVAVEAASVLLRLPPLPGLGATANGSNEGARVGAGRNGSGAMLERVRALLAKAESTTFPEEAEALTAKAQELMARHAIDQAVLDAGSNGGSAGVVGWRIGIDDPYAAAKSILLYRIAVANRCRGV